jgi:hypothetical protein
VAGSFVASCNATEVVPAGSVPDGCPLLRTGGVVSFATSKAIVKSVVLALLEASMQRTW